MKTSFDAVGKNEIEFLIFQMSRHCCDWRVGAVWW